MKTVMATDTQHKKAILIDVFILQAVGLKAQKNEKDALEKITEALSLSSIGNCIRTYVDYGMELKDLLVGFIKFPTCLILE